MNLTIRKKRKQSQTSNNSTVHKGKKICVVGLGYISLPTAAVLANAEYQVHGVDVNHQVVDTLRQGKIHIHEPGLETFVKQVIQNNRLTVSHSPEEADIFIICVHLIMTTHLMSHLLKKLAKLSDPLFAQAI